MKKEVLASHQRGPGGGHRGLRAVAGLVRPGFPPPERGLCRPLPGVRLGGTGSQGTAQQYSPHQRNLHRHPGVGRFQYPARHDLAALQAENSDCVGWLTIPDTGIDYPIMHTPDEPEHYLRRDFYGNHASGGTPFLDGRNTAQAEGQNLIVYGHNMLDGSMFKPLINYLDADFRETHQDIYLELGDTQYRYQVLAVLETTVESPVYRYTDLSDPAVESDFRSALFQAANLDVIHHTEGYLTLSTCGDWGGDTRVLVVASLAEEVGE